jgi:hypothetical protein
MFFLSKEDTEIPPVGRVRPIAIYSPIRKLIEIIVDRIDRNMMWASIS